MTGAFHSGWEELNEKNEPKVQAEYLKEYISK